MKIRLQTLGPPRCFANGALTDLSAHKSRFALLTYLAFQRRVARAALYDFFWPELSEAAAEHALGHALEQLCARLGTDWIVQDKHALAVTAQVTVDALEFKACIERGDFAAANALYQGPFLADFQVDSSLQFQSWVADTRHELKRLQQHARDHQHDQQQPAAAGVPLWPKAGFFAELRQRRVPRMAAWYVATVFLVLQAGQTLVDVLYVPRWTLTATAALAVLGFPLTLVLSWYFEITPDGRLIRDPRAGPLHAQWRVVLTGFVLATSGVIAAFVAPLVRPAGSESVAVTCADGSRAPCVGAMPVEENRFVVLPLTHADATEPHLIDGELCAHLLTEGLSRWHDINIVERLRVKQALLALPAGIRAELPVDTAIVVARRLGAGKLITGELWHYGDTTRVDAYLYDVRSGRQLKRKSERFASGSVEAQRAFQQVAEEFVVENSELHVSVEAAIATNSVAAMHALSSALRKVDEWDLSGAESHFKVALQRDPAYPHAHLWLAYVLLWKNDTSAAWRLHAERAAASTAALSPDNQLLAQGIAALASRRFGLACESYRELLSKDSLSFYGWFGLGECLRRDPSVVRDSGSPSGWRFVTSWHEAINAHQRALWLVPSFNAAFINLGSSQLEKLLFLTAGRLRTGVAAQRDSLKFGAWPELEADTLKLVPYPYQQWSQREKPLSGTALVQRHRDQWSESVASWARMFPDNPRALEALAWTLEFSGRLVPTAERGNSALALLRRAREFESDRSRQLQLAAAETRVLVKAGRFKDARHLALQTLQKHSDPTPRDALLLAGLAGLTGRPHLMVRMLVIGADSTDYDKPLSGETVEIPPPVARATAALLGYAYLGAPVDSVRALSERAHQTLNTFVAPQRRPLVHQTGLDRAARIAFPIMGIDEVHRRPGPAMPFISEQAALARGDSAGVRRALDDLEERRQRQNPTDFASDGILTIAQLRLALGDTTRVIEVLDGYLHDLGNMPRYHFRQPYQPAALVRLMAMRAELAAAQGDRANARRWSRAVVDFWEQSDRELQPVARRMRSLARF